MAENDRIMTRKKQKKVPSERNEMAFAVEIARGTSIVKAATKVGISETTGYRWARKPEVVKSIAEVRSTVLQTASQRMMNIAGKAVETLETLLGSDDDKIRLSAAKAVIDGTAKMRQLAELEQELEQIHKTVLWLRQHHNQGGPNRV